MPYFTNLIRIVRAEGPKEAQKATNERQSAKMSWIVLRRNSARQDFPLELWVANATKMSASHWIAARLTMYVLHQNMSISGHFEGIIISL